MSKNWMSIVLVSLPCRSGSLSLECSLSIRVFPPTSSPLGFLPRVWLSFSLTWVSFLSRDWLVFSPSLHCLSISLRSVGFLSHQLGFVLPTGSSLFINWVSFLATGFSLFSIIWVSFGRLGFLWWVRCPSLPSLPWTKQWWRGCLIFDLLRKKKRKFQ